MRILTRVKEQNTLQTLIKEYYTLWSLIKNTMFYTYIMTTVNLTATTSLPLNLIASLFLLSFLFLLLLFYWWGLQQVMTLWSDSLHMLHQWSKCFTDAVTDLMFFCCSFWDAQTFSCCIHFFFDCSQNT